ncbi:S-adenosyl-L-methionine-dependent methyltransferase [Flammula alnicola]|nr:S-adenosyl-L-methionine-dependent methyltransferase [Flammula alnicola]
MSSSSVRVTNYPAIKNAPLVGLAEGNGSFSNYHLAALLIVVPYILKTFLPIVKYGGFKTYLFMFFLCGAPTAVGYWAFNSIYGGRRNEKVVLPGKDIEEYITIKDPELKQVFKGKEKIPMQLFHDAYFEGKIDFNGDVLDIMEQRHDWAKMNFTLELFKYVFTVLVPSQDEEQVRGHYDRGDDFYEWYVPRPRMIYTSGVVLNPDVEETLEQLQDNKLAIVCSKLNLKPTDKLLDIGCGWDSRRLCCKNYGCDATFGTERIAKNGIPADKARILCCDYRDIPEAPTRWYPPYSQYLAEVYDLLEDDGIFWQYEDLIWYGSFHEQICFPALMHLAPLDGLINKLEGAGFEIKNIDVLGVHYSATIYRWYKNWVSNKEKVHCQGLGIFLAYSVITSRYNQGSASVFQITMHKN